MRRPSRPNRMMRARVNFRVSKKACSSETNLLRVVGTWFKLFFSRLRITTDLFCANASPSDSPPRSPILVHTNHLKTEFSNRVGNAPAIYKVQFTDVRIFLEGTGQLGCILVALHLFCIDGRSETEISKLVQSCTSEPDRGRCLKYLPQK